MSHEEEGKLAASVAERAGQIALEFQRKGITAETKADESPVTAADRACEAFIVDELLKAYPNDGLLGEEGANRNGTSGRKWIIDPIDGTKDFVRGIPLWSVLIGLESQGEVVAGAACCPGQNLTLCAWKGGGTWANGSPVRISGVEHPARSVLSFNGFNKAGATAMGEKLLTWISQFWAVRGLGGAMDAMLLAMGRADVWMEPNAQPWDLAALKILVEEAGGRFGSFTGKNTIYGGNAWACTPALAPHVAQLLGF